MNILVSGSLAYDRIMNFPGSFKDHILPEKIHILNVSFAVDNLHQNFGGTAGNIAYSLSLLGFKPSVLGAVGKDFGVYKEWLDKLEIDTSLVKIIEDKYTASAHIITDKDDNQITGFYPGAMNDDHLAGLEDLNLEPQNSWAIVSPAGTQGMMKRVDDYKELNIPYIFDPGQQIVALSKEELLKGLEGAQILIGNDYEIEMIMNKTDLKIENILERSEMLITTRGAEGSVMQSKDNKVEIPPAKPEKVIDPTGAGDAYRAGLLKGLIEKKSLAEIGRLAATSAVYAVEHHGTQEHYYTINEFEKRYQENFD